MALIVETGEGLAQADSFFGLPEAAIYFAERGLTSWGAASDNAKEAAARQAADYMRMGYSWKGQPRYITQRLPWPRAYVQNPENGEYISPEIIPLPIKEAAMLLAYAGLTDNLIVERPSERIVEKERKELAGLGAIETTYAVPRAKSADIQRYPAVDALLSPYIISSRASGGLQSRPAIRR